jgi:hypothetical protein
VASPKVISGRMSALLLESRFAGLNYTLAAPVLRDPRFDYNLIGKHQICRIGIYLSAVLFTRQALWRVGRSRHPLGNTYQLRCKMNKNKFLVIVILIVAIGCNHPNNPIIPNTESYFTANIGAATWTGLSYLDFGPKDYQCLFFEPHNGFTYLRVDFKFGGQGQYQLLDSSAVLVETEGGDISLGAYYSNGTIQDVLTITEYDSINSFVTGNLSCKIKKDTALISITVNEFKAVLINRNQ